MHEQPHFICIRIQDKDEFENNQQVYVLWTRPDALKRHINTIHDEKSSESDTRESCGNKQDDFEIRVPRQLIEIIIYILQQYL